MRIALIGTGYVGLVTGTCFAEMGHEVICLDIDEEKIRSLKAGEVPIYEPGLQERMVRNAGRLHFTTSYAEALETSEILFLAVPTPCRKDGSADLRFIESAARMIGRHMQRELIVATKSTVPPGTTYKVRDWIREESDIPFSIASNPEFLKEGDAISDCLKPARVIVGVEDARVADAFRTLYAPFTLSQERLLVMDITSAEISKYAANAMLATRISFMNEMARICEEFGGDIDQVRASVGSDPRIGRAYLYAGAGFGGSCLPKDIRALQNLAGEIPLLAAVEQINRNQQKRLLSRVKEYLGTLAGKRIGIWGLAFKPETDDTRDAPALALIEELKAAGVQVQTYDPIVPSTCDSELEAAQEADAIILMTEWKQFRGIDLLSVREVMRGCAFFDGRNQYRPDQMAALGFDYFSIGRPSTHAGLLAS